MKEGKVSEVRAGSLEQIAKHFIDDSSKTITLHLYHKIVTLYLNRKIVVDKDLATMEGKRNEDEKEFTFSQKDGMVGLSEEDEPVTYLRISQNKSSTACCLFPVTRKRTHGPFASNIISFPSTGDMSNIVFQLTTTTHPELFQNFEIPLKFENVTSHTQNVIFHIEPGQYSDCIIPTEVEELWGPMPLKRLPDGVDNTCLAVTHRIKKNSAMEKTLKRKPLRRKCNLSKYF